MLGVLFIDRFSGVQRIIWLFKQVQGFFKHRWRISNYLIWPIGVGNSKQSATLVLLRKVKPIIIFYTGLLMTWSVSAVGDVVSIEDMAQLDLEELMELKVITATQIETEPFKLPFITEVYTRQDYEQMLPRTLPQWLSEAPGIMDQKTAYGQLSPYIRGLTGFRTLMLIDGIRLNNSTFREGPNQYWNTIDPLSVQQLEIVKGPASVLYGSDSISGTVNAISKGWQDYSEGRDTNGSVLYRYGSAENSHIGRAEYRVQVNESAGLHIGASIKSFGDITAGPALGKRPHTGYDEQDVDAKYDYFLQTNVKLTLAHQTVVQDDIWRTHSTIYGDIWQGAVHGSDLQRSTNQQRHLTYAQMHVTDLNGFITSAHISISDHIQKEEQYRMRKDSRFEFSGVDVNTLGAFVKLESPTRFGTWVYGVTFYRDWVDSFTMKYNSDGTLREQKIQGPVADNATYDLIGIYAQNQLPSWGPVNFTVRGRYDRARADLGRMLDPVSGTATSFSQDWNSLVGSIRAAAHLDRQEHWLIFGGASQGFRAPNLSDLSRLDIAGSGQIETPSSDVEPEYYMMYETGVKAHYDRINVQAAYYYTDIDGMIIREPSGRVIDGLDEVTKRNSGRGFIQGVELEGHFQVMPGLTARGAYTWMDSEITVYPTSDPTVSEVEPISRLMPMTGLLALRWEPEPKKYRAEAICTMVAEQDKLSSRDISDVQRIPPGGTPGYTVWTLRAGWQPRKNLMLSVNIENLTDEDYRVHGSGLNEPGRNVILAGNIWF